MKNYLKTLIAVVVLAAVWGGVTLYNRRQSKEQPKTAPAKAPEKLTTLAKDHVQQITIKPKDGDTFVLSKGSGSGGQTGWAITSPLKVAADQSGVSTFLDNLTGATIDQVIDPQPANLKDFGLDAPTTTIELTSDSDQQFKLLLGDETPASDGLYAQVAGNPQVIMLASYLKNSLEKKMFDLRDRRGLTLDMDKVQRIDVSSKDTKGAKQWTLEKNPEGSWDLVLPPPVRADRFSVEGLVNQLRDLTMQSVTAEDKKKAGSYGLSSPVLTIKVTAQTGTQTVTVGKQDGGHYNAVNSALDPIFTINSDVVTQFQKDPADLRDKDLFSGSLFDAKHLEVTTAKGPRVFDKQQDKWKQTAPAAKDEATDKMQQLLTDLGEVRVTSFPAAKAGSLAEFGLDKPAYSFKVTYGDNKTETVEIGVVGTNCYARRPSDALPGTIAKATVDSIEKDLGQL